MKKVSVKEIARIANVSIGTVDRVLHKRGRVSPVTEKKILKIIRDLEYKPNVFASNLKLSKTFHFGVVMPGLHQDSSYWSLPYRGMQKAAEELQSLKIKIHYYFFDKFDETSFRQQFWEAIKKNLDGLIMAPVLYEASRELFKTIPPELPYIFFDSFIPDASPLSVIGQDSTKAGRLAGSIMQLLLPQGGKVVVMRTLPWDYHIEQRIRGFKDFLTQLKGFQTEVVDIPEQERADTYQNKTRLIIRDHPDLGGIFVPHANTYPFARGIAAKSWGRKIAVIGFDLIEENLELLHTGKIDFLISQRPMVQGYQSIYTLYRHCILKEKIVAEIPMPLEIINRENAVETSFI